jgi:hypothetical protein
MPFKKVIPVYPEAYTELMEIYSVYSVDKLEYSV